MDEEKSLIKVEHSIFSRIRQAVLNFFHKFKKTKSVEPNFQEQAVIKQEIKKEERTMQIGDFETLKNVVNKKIEIKDLDVDTEKRLIELCDNRLKQMDEIISQKDLKIAKMEKLLDDLTVYNAN